MNKTIQNICLVSTFVASSAIAEPVVEQPWLRNHLPQEIAAYVRIPHPLFIFAEADTPLKPMYQNESYKKQISEIKQAILSKLDLKYKDRQALNMLFKHLRAPIEAAVPGKLSVREIPTLLVATKVDYKSTDDLEEDVISLLQDSPIEIVPADGDTGIIKQKRSPNPIGTYHYSPESGKLLITAGSKSKLFEGLLDAEASESSPIERAEKLIDESGQGLLVVLKPTPELFKMAPLKRKQRELIENLKINEAKEVALGFGVSNKQPKVKLYVDMPKEGLRTLIPAYAPLKDVPYYGQLSSSFTLSLPNKEGIETLLPLLNIKNDDYIAFQEKFLKDSGISWDMVEAMFGRSFSYVNDDNGNYLVTDASFSKQVNDLVKKLNDNGLPITLTEKSVGDKKLHHLNITPLLRKMEKKSLSVSTLMGNNHYYWVEENGAVLISTLPQPLLARDGQSKNLLEKVYPTAKDESPDTFFSAIVNTRNLSQNSYYNNLKILNALSDFADVPFDVSSYPTANTLNFDRHGKLGFRISNGGDLLSMELTATNGVMDVFEADGMVTIAAVGILSAIAIPAYQDYILKSKLTRAYVSAQTLKSAIENKAKDGLKDINDSQFSEELASMRSQPGISSVHVVDGVIKININRSNSLTLTPVIKEEKVTSWKCTGVVVKYKYLPNTCH